MSAELPEVVAVFDGDRRTATGKVGKSAVVQVPFPVEVRPAELVGPSRGG